RQRLGRFVSNPGDVLAIETRLRERALGHPPQPVEVERLHVCSVWSAERNTPPAQNRCLIGGARGFLEARVRLPPHATLAFGPTRRTDRHAAPHPQVGI